MKFTALFTALLLAFSPVMADELPNLGEVSQSTLSPQQERRIGESIMEEVRVDATYLDDVEVAEYLNELGYRLVSNSPDNQRDIEFFALRDNTLNAFALPGGFIGVHSGLILAAQNESELAGVLAHEIAHVTQGHLARMIARQNQGALASIAALAIAILAARSNPQIANAALATAQASTIQTQLDFTREHEREADRTGLQILQKAQFDSRAMAAFFEKLLRYGRLYENNAPTYLRTHPLTTERIADMQNRVEKMPYRQIPSSMEFQLIRAKLRATQGDATQVVAEFEQNLTEKKYDSETAARYGLIQALSRAGKLTRAEQEMATLRKNSKPAAMIETLAAQLKTANQQWEPALAIYRTALKKYPRHRALIYGYADTLLQTHQSDEASRFIGEQLRAYPSDYRLYELQARSFAQQNKPGQQHLAQAEAYARSGKTHAAIEQLEIALKSKGDDFYQLSIVEARLKELKSLEKEKLKTKY